jgi:hypothetical protein
MARMPVAGVHLRRHARLSADRLQLFSYQLDNLFGKSDEADGTGSLRLAPKPRAIEEAPAGGDLEIARAAVNEVLAKARNDISVL